MLNPLHKDIIQAANKIVCELDCVTKETLHNKKKLTPHQKIYIFLV